MKGESFFRNVWPVVDFPCSFAPMHGSTPHMCGQHQRNLVSCPKKKKKKEERKKEKERDTQILTGLVGGSGKVEDEVGVDMIMFHCIHVWSSREIMIIIF